MIEQVGTHGTPLVRRVLPEGLRRLGEWPSADTLAEHLPEILRLAAQQAEDSETGKALLRGADVLQGVATGTLTVLIRRVMGLA